jgi:hypothetical protein
VQQTAGLTGGDFLYHSHLKINTLKLLNVPLVLCTPDHNPLLLRTPDMESRIVPKAAQQLVVSGA